MSASLDIAALRLRFADQWATRQPTVPVVYDNASATTDHTDAFVRFSVRASDERPVSLGAHRYEQIGRIVVQVCVPRGEGTGLADELADEVSAIYRNWSSDDFAVRCEGVSRSTKPADERDPWHVVKVGVLYRSIRNY